MIELTGGRTTPSALCRVFCFVFVTLLPFSIGVGDARADKLEFKTIAKSAGPRDLISIPSTCRLASGDILVVYHQLCCHMCFGIHDQPWVDYYKARMPELTPSCPLPNKGRLMGIRSSDEGQSWSEPFVVVDGPSTDSDPQVSVAPDGTVYLVYCIRRWYRKHSKIDQFSGHTPYPEYPRYVDTGILTSSDDGRSWSEPDILPMFYEHRDSCHDPIKFFPDGTLMMAIQCLPRARIGDDAGLAS